MKTGRPRLVRFRSFLFVAVWAVALHASAQERPNLGLRFSSGQPTLILTGSAGTFYSIQYATSLSPTNLWVDRTLLQAQGGGNVWIDPAPSVSGHLFYRAVSVTPPAHTNLVFIQPGTFIMGSPANEAERSSDEVQHRVRISQGFWMGKFLVTQGDYLAVVGSNPSYFKSANLNLPVEQVSWYDASNYCVLLTQQERTSRLLPTNYVYRLPTEAEWEYACRAGTTTAFYQGSSLHSGQANFDGKFEYDAILGTSSNSNGVYLGTTTAVGSYAANGWGLYDMIGNLFEWCQDWYGVYPAGNVIDPQGAVLGNDRLIRGGDWNDDAINCRSAIRRSNPPGIRNIGIGFRIVLAAGE
jgi:formylglycine-generating enzyme required for sulfatase activity